MAKARPAPETDCPSAQPEMAGARVLGVVSWRGDRQQLAYLNSTVPVTEELLAEAGPVAPTEIYRFAARCQESKCQHFDGQDCGLAKRIVDMLPETTSALPPCVLRRSCRWYLQEGREACLRCPGVVTHVRDPDGPTRELAEPVAAGADGE